MYRGGLSRVMLCANVGILLLWGVWGLFDVVSVGIAGDYVFLRFESFGLISPFVGLVCLFLSVVGLFQARLNQASSEGEALVAIGLSIVIGAVPLLSLLAACDGPCYT